MRKVRRIPHKPGSFRRRAVVDEVIDRLHGDAANLESDVTVSVGDDLTAGELADSAERLISRRGFEDRHPLGEAAVSPMSFPELAGLKTAVSGFGLKDSGQCLLFANEFEFAPPRFHIRVRRGHAVVTGVSWRPMIEVDTVLMRIQACQQRDQRRTTDATGRISVGESGGLRGKSVEVWRMDALVTHEAEVRPGVIISNDVNDVGAFGSACRSVVSVQRNMRRE